MIRCAWLQDEEKRTLESGGASVVSGLGIACSFSNNSVHICRVGKVPLTFSLADVVECVCGINHVLFRTVSGDVFAFGSNLHGQCGIGDKREEVQAPSKVFEGAARIFAAASASFIVDLSGNLFVCGCNDYTQLSLPEESSCVETFRAVAGHPKPVDALSSGFGHTCILSEGSMYFCGSNSHDQLDFITDERSISAWCKAEPSNIRAIACGVWHSGFICASGSIHLCGRGPFYQQGPQPLDELLADVKRIRERNALSVFDKWVNLPVPEEVVDIRIGSSLGIALASTRRRVYVFDTVEYVIREAVDFPLPVRTLSCFGRWWSVS
jgi:alpha-tubulin suppressor-like RCC1 family protein